MNRNIICILTWRFLDRFSRSLWGGAVFVGYIFVLSDSYKIVGIAEGAQGLVKIAISIIWAIWADRFTRAAVIRGAASLMTVTLATFIYAVHTRSLTWVCVLFSIYGACEGVLGSACDTAFNDSLLRDDRVRYNAKIRAGVEFMNGLGVVTRMKINDIQRNVVV